MPKVLIKRGLSSNLPVSADAGEMLVTTDTKSLYVGSGSGQPLLQVATQGPQGLTGAQGTQGPQGTAGSGSSILRYVTASSPNCQVLATGAGVDVVITGSNPPTATITVPGGVQLISASIYFTAAQIGTSAVSFSIVMPTGFGIGLGANYYCVQAQCYRDTGGARAALGTYNFNTGQGTLQMTGLVTNSAYVVNLAF